MDALGAASEKAPAPCLDRYVIARPETFSTGPAFATLRWNSS